MLKERQEKAISLFEKEELEKRRRADIEEAVQRARQAREKEKAKTQT